jgi:hypothetical protein
MIKRDEMKKIKDELFRQNHSGGRCLQRNTRRAGDVKEMEKPLRRSAKIQVD